jgi:hypothetical protein
MDKVSGHVRHADPEGRYRQQPRDDKPEERILVTE